VRAILLLLPAVLSALVLGAHFLRRGDVPLVLACLVVCALLFVRRGWAARLVQLALLAGTLEWLRTLVALLATRRAAGEPWVRLVAILGLTAAVSLAGVLLLETRALRARFRRGAARPAAPPGREPG
jgi:hypothetical protein